MAVLGVLGAATGLGFVGDQLAGLAGGAVAAGRRPAEWFWVVAVRPGRWRRGASGAV